MVQATNIKGEIVFKCTQCGWLYREKEIAERCERWCGEHKSCNLDIAKYAIKQADSS